MSRRITRRNWMHSVTRGLGGLTLARLAVGCAPSAPPDDNGSPPVDSGRPLFDACLTSGQKASRVQRDVDSGRALGVAGTPTFFVNGRILIGNQSLASFEALLAAAPPFIDDPLLVPAVDDHFKGDLGALNTIVEYGDFECPICGAFFRNNLPDINAFLVESGRAVYVFRHFPLRSLHTRAQAAAEAAECAADQNAFFPYHDLLFENQANLSDADLRAYADQLGLS